MLTRLDITNFRKFDRFAIDFGPRNLLVGANNAGKSTLIEAIRLVSIVVNRLGALNFGAPPEWLDPGLPRGVAPSLRGLDFDLGREIFHHYADPPATIVARFSSGDSVTVDIGVGADIFAVARDSEGIAYTTKAQARALRLPRIGIQPQVGPLARMERPLNDRYVRGALDSTLAPLHFRNQLRLLEPYFEDFKAAAESTWPGLAIDGIEAEGLGDERRIGLYLRDGGFVGEASAMGHGLQMWLQLMWFLARSRDDGTVVLDEPDVYMHPDLQRRLLRFVLSRNQQVIIATHSVEMMAEVDPEDLLPIDASRRSARRTSSISEVQRIVEQLGSVHNLQYARLARADACLIAPASDVPQLKRWSDLLANPNDRAIDTLPMLPCNSWASWPYAMAAKRTIDQSRGSSILARCFMPSARLPAEFLARRRREAAESGIELHIWQLCDLTSYLVRPDIIARLLSRHTEQPVDPELVAAELWALSHPLRPDVVRELRSDWRALRQSVDGAEAFVTEAWATMPRRLRVVSGRDLLLGASAWSQSSYDIQLGLRDVAREFKADDLDPEVRRALRTSIADAPEAPAAGPLWPWRHTAAVSAPADAPDAEEILRLLFGVSGSI